MESDPGGQETCRKEPVVSLFGEDVGQREEEGGEFEEGGESEDGRLMGEHGGGDDQEVGRVVNETVDEG